MLLEKSNGMTMQKPLDSSKGWVQMKNITLMKVLQNLLIPCSMLETMYDLILTFVTRAPAMRLPMLQLYEMNQEIELCIFHIWYKKFCICIYINFDIFCASLNPCLSNYWLHNIRNIPLPYIWLNVFPINSGILPSKKIYIFIHFSNNYIISLFKKIFKYN